MEGRGTGTEPGLVVGAGREDHRGGIAEGEGNSGRRRLRGIQEGTPMVCLADTHGIAGTQAE
eukprot:7489147-Alexandrium_andersonii.AAC.1